MQAQNSYLETKVRVTMCRARPAEQILCSVRTPTQSYSLIRKGRGDELGGKSLHPLDKITLSGALGVPGPAHCGALPPGCQTTPPLGPSGSF